MPRRKHHKRYVKATTRAFGGPRKGSQVAIGPASWRNLFVKGNATKPMVGSGKGSLQIARMGMGPQTIKRSGPVLF